MADWLCIDEAPLQKDVKVSVLARGGPHGEQYVVTLRGVRVLNNKKIFGGADVNLHAVVVDGLPDMKTKLPFWAQDFSFPAVKDGDLLPIDPELGFQLYRGEPVGFLNLYVLAVRNKKASRNFAAVLKENMIANEIGTVAGGAISVFADLPQVPGIDAIRNIVTKSVNVTIDYFVQQKNPVIGVYYGSLTPENHWGEGMRPPGFPDEMIDCGDSLQLAYAVEEVKA
jgi:hypothetical protein